MAENERVGRPVGGSTIENVRLNLQAPVHVNELYEPPEVHVRPIGSEDRKHYCCMCGKSYVTQEGNFPSNTRSPLWKGNNGYVPFCKWCCGILMSSLTSFYSGNDEHALKHICAIFDWFYCDAASAASKRNEGRFSNRVTAYATSCSSRAFQARGQTFLDTVKGMTREEERVSVLKRDCTDENAESDEEFIVTKEMVRTWGHGFTPDQYQFLEEEYADWVGKCVCNTKAQEELFKNIALAQLDIRIARQRGAKISDAQSELQKLMNSANILPKQTAENILADTQTFGTLLKKYEETDPIPEPDERWRDVDGIRRYMNTWFRGGLAKALKLNNESSRLYEEAVEEMERYTVRPVVEDMSAGANDASIFDVAAEESRDD